MNHAEDHDALVLIHRQHPAWNLDNCRAPLFVCAEMFLTLRDIESRRWTMWSLRESLREAALPCTTLAEFLQPDDIAWLEQQGARVAHDWYLNREGDQTMYRGISLGRCIEYDVKARAIRLLKLSLSIQRLVQCYPGRKILADFPAGSIEWRLLENLQIPLKRFGDGEGAQVAFRPQTRSASRSARMVTRGRHWGLSALRALSGILAVKPSAAEPLVVVRVGMQSSKMLESWLTHRRTGIRFCLWMDYLMRPRTMLSLVKAGSFVTDAFPPAPKSGGPQLAQIERRLIELFAERRPEFHAELGEHLQPLLNDMLHEVSGRAFPVACASVDDAYRTLRLPHVTLLVVPTDCQPLMRAWVLVAKGLSTPSLVLQHGHLDYTEDEDHLTADHSAFWSTTVAQDFLDAGLDAAHVVVTGSPNADDYVQRQSPQRRRPDSALSEKPRVLIITTGNPGVQAYVKETWVCDYIAGILDALAGRGEDFSVEIKLHPGEDAGLYRQHLGTRLPVGVEVTDRGNLVQMISEADVVISPPSTVVLEARAGGAPVILLPLPSVEGRKTTLEYVEGVVTVDRYDELPAAIDTILTGRSHPRTGSWPLARFFGPLDGKSSSRLLDAVHSLAHSRRSVEADHLTVSSKESHVLH